MKTKLREDLMLKMYLNLLVTTNILFMVMKLILIYTADEVDDVYDVDKQLLFRCQTVRTQISHQRVWSSGNGSEAHSRGKIS